MALYLSCYMGTSTRLARVRSQLVSAGLNWSQLSRAQKENKSKYNARTGPGCNFMNCAQALSS